MRTVFTYQLSAIAESCSHMYCTGIAVPGMIVTTNVADQFSKKQTPVKKNPPVRRADMSQGDGGVDVTGAPKSRSVEGADFGRLFCLSVGKRSHWDRILAEVQVNNRFTWGLQFLSRFVFAQVNARLL